jgi:hypothetical protein
VIAAGGKAVPPACTAARTADFAWQMRRSLLWAAAHRLLLLRPLCAAVACIPNPPCVEVRLTASIQLEQTIFHRFQSSLANHLVDSLHSWPPKRLLQDESQGRALKTRVEVWYGFDYFSCGRRERYSYKTIFKNYAGNHSSNTSQYFCSSHNL